VEVSNTTPGGINGDELREMRIESMYFCYSSDAFIFMILIQNVKVAEAQQIGKLELKNQEVKDSESPFIQGATTSYSKLPLYQNSI
jgi:hypothetical protein